MLVSMAGPAHAVVRRPVRQGRVRRRRRHHRRRRRRRRHQPAGPDPLHRHPGDGAVTSTATRCPSSAASAGASTAAKNLHRILAGKRVQLTARHANSYSSQQRAPAALRGRQGQRRSGPTSARCSSTPAWCCPTCMPGRVQQQPGLRPARADRRGQPRRLLGRADPLRHRPVPGRPARGRPSTGTPTATTARTSTASGSTSPTAGSTPCRLAGWWVRDAAYRGQQGARLRRSPPAPRSAPGEQGPAAGRARHRPATASYYWGLDIPIFANVTDGAKCMGDGAWLFDPQGDLRAWYMYPCRAAC